MALLPGAAIAGLALVVALAYLGLVVHAGRHRSEPGAVAFGSSAALMAAMPVALLASAEWLALPSWGAVPVGGLHLLAPLWAWFAFEYTGLWGWTSASRLALLVVPPTIGVVDVTYILIVGAPVAPPSLGLAQTTYILAVMYSFGLAIAATALLAWAGFAYASTDRRRVLALAVGMASLLTLPTVLGSVLAPGRTVPDSYLLGYLLSAGPFWLAVLRYDLFESVPVAEAVGRERVVSELDDPVVVVDDDGRLMDANSAAEQGFGVQNPEAIGTSLETLLDGEAPSTSELDERGTVTVRDGNRRRHYEVTVSSLADEAGSPRGHALVFHDVTDRQLRRQRLDVLNRVLRHNLRNEMVTITGYASVIADGHDGDLSRLGTDIENAGDRLVALSDRAREIDRLMSAEPVPAAVSVAGVVEEVLDDVSDHDVHVERDVPPDLTAEVDRKHLLVVLENLLDNAARYGDGTVTVSGRRTDDDTLPVEVVVADEGPGLPESELAVVRDGEESDLEHASGLGLWAVAWGTARIGGTVEFETDDTGTTVTLRLPAA